MTFELPWDSLFSLDLLTAISALVLEGVEEERASLALPCRCFPSPDLSLSSSSILFYELSLYSSSSFATESFSSRLGELLPDLLLRRTLLLLGLWLGFFSSETPAPPSPLLSVILVC